MWPEASLTSYPLCCSSITHRLRPAARNSSRAQHRLFTTLQVLCGHSLCDEREDPPEEGRLKKPQRVRSSLNSRFTIEFDLWVGLSSLAALVFLHARRCEKLMRLDFLSVVKVSACPVCYEQLSECLSGNRAENQRTCIVSFLFLRE